MDPLAPILFSVLVAVAAAVGFWTGKQQKHGFVVKPLLTANEIAVYTALVEQLGAAYRVFPKVAASAVLSVENAKGNAELSEALVTIAHRNIDFLICYQETLAIAAAIVHAEVPGKSADKYIGLLTSTLRAASVRVFEYDPAVGLSTGQIVAYLERDRGALTA